MRVTHVITRLIVGGAQENTVTTVLGLRQRPGWEITLISGPSSGAEGSLASAFAKTPGTLFLLPELVRPVRPWKDWIALRRLTAVFRNDKPRIVHTHSGKAGILGRLAAAKAGVPVIVHTIHGPSFGPFQGALANRFARLAERRAGRVTTHFISVADAMTRRYLAAGIGRPDQYTTIRSGFDLAPFLAASNDPQLRARWNIAPEDVVIGKIARLSERKGHDDLLSVAPELIRRCPRARLLLVGDGALRPRLEARARSMGLNGRIVFAGLVAPADIPQLVGIMDLLAHVSLREGLPRALPQALAAAKPVVAYDTDGSGEICLDHETGFLVRPGDLPALTSRLVELASNPALRARFGRRGRDLVKAQFGAEQMVDAIAQLYLRLAAGAPAASP
jgi:glycosyltransferase involved in cell wall biosynthesis